MKTSTLLLAASLAGASLAQLGNLPSCATSCLTQYTSGGKIAGCNGVDIKCICSNSSFLSGIACCLAASCSEADQQAATEYAEKLCSTNGVTNLPPSVSCDSTATQTQTSSGSATGGASTSPSSAAATTTGSSTGSATGSATGAGATTTASGSPSGSSSSPSPSSSTGAGVQNIAAMGAGLAGGIAAVAALL